MTSRSLGNVLFACVFGIVFTLAACGARSVTEVGGETNWLMVCNADNDCKQGSCECGVCTKTCDAMIDCAGAFEGRCVASETQPVEALCSASSTPPGALCLPKCEHDADCGDRFTCVSASCVPRSTSGANDGTDGGTRDGGNEPDASLPIATNRWTGNPTECPGAPPSTGTGCGPEALTCAYSYKNPNTPAQHEYTECACRMGCDTDAPVLRWDCYRHWSIAGAGTCPVEQPEQGTSCFGLKGTTCPYPLDVECECPATIGNDDWDCRSQRVDLPMLPANFPGSKRIRDLTDGDRQNWCAWLTEPEPGFPSPPEVAPDADGYYPEMGCATQSGTLGCPGIMEPHGYPASVCVANLALSSCEATLGDLTDCVLTVRFQQPAPHGCAPYLTAPGCGDTIILGTGDSLADAGAGSAGTTGGSAAPGAASCRLRVR